MMYMIMCRARGTGREKRKVSLFQNSLTFARVLHNTPLSTEACLVVCVSRLQIQFQFTPKYQERVWRAQVRFSRGAPLNAPDTALVSTVQHTSAGDTMQRREDDASTCHASRARSDSPHSSADYIKETPAHTIHIAAMSMSRASCKSSTRLSSTPRSSQPTSTSTQNFALRCVLSRCAA